jgi:hypothetical protein
MMNHFKAFVLLFSLSLVNTGFATPNSNATSPALGSLTAPEWTLPAPAMVIVVSVGTTWSRINWTPVSGAFNYRIITTDVASGMILNNIVIPATTNNAQIEPLPPGTTVLSTVYAIDQYGIQGAGRGVQYDTIIIDTVGKFSAPNSGFNTVCTVPIIIASEQGGCPIQWNGNPSYFRITYSEYVGYFKTEKINDAKMKLSHDVGSDFSFTPGESGISEVLFNGGMVGRMACLKNTITGEVSVLRKGTNGNNPNVVIQKIVYLEPLFGGIDGNAFEVVQEIDLTPRLMAMPNPFTDQFEIQIPFADEENVVQLSLYDLQGRMMLSQNIAGGSPIQTIETGTLPTGVYFLRVECGGKAETIKVVKTQ